MENIHFELLRFLCLTLGYMFVNNITTCTTILLTDTIVNVEVSKLQTILDIAWNINKGF